MNDHLANRNLLIKTYHPTKGDALLTVHVIARRDRQFTDPWFADLAKKIVTKKRLGQVVEWKVIS